MARRNNSTATATVTDTATVQEDTMNNTDTATVTAPESTEIETPETVDNTVVTEPEIDAAPVSATGLIWSAPPATIAPKRAKGAKRAAKVAELMAHPYEWAIVASNLKYTTATTEWRKEGLEVRHGKPEGSDLFSIWARYNPEYTAEVQSGKRK